MGKRQADRLKDVIAKIIGTATKAAGGAEYSGDVAEDYPQEWNKILRVTGLHPDSKRPSHVDVFKDNTFLPLVNVTELTDAVINTIVIVESANDKELIPLKVTSFDNDKQIVTGILPNEYEMGFSYRSIRGHKA